MNCQNGLRKKHKKISKAHGKPKSNIYSIKNQGKLPQNRQMPTKHNNVVTCCDISTLKGSWEASPDQMLTDFIDAHTCALNQPSCFTEEGKISPHAL